MRRRWTWVALSLLAFFVISMVITTILSVANGSFQQDPAGFLMQLVGFSAFMVVGALSMPTGPGPGRVIANPIGVGWLGDPEESPVGVARLRVDSLDLLGAVVRQAEVIMAASAPAGGALVASRPVWTPVVAASETPDPAVQDGVRRSGSRSSSEVDSTSRGTTSRA